ANKLSKISSSPKYGFSTILRIADSNINEEEHEYWDKHGKDLFKWSELMHKVGRGVRSRETSHGELIENWYQATQKIPPSILAHYKNHRDKNFTVNSYWLDSLHSHLFQYLIFACDDSSRYGMNVVEAEYLKKLIQNHRFSYLTKVITGTDEVSLILLAKAFIAAMNIAPSVALFFTDEKGKEIVGKYETNSICSVVQDQLNILNIVVKDIQSSDLVICVHVPRLSQGDHIFGVNIGETQENINRLLEFLNKNQKPFVIIDVAYANGSDPVLIKTLAHSNINWDLCYGYAGWNTTSNTSGTALAMGICRWIAEKNNSFNLSLFKKTFITRLLDDYAYQVVIRQKKQSLSDDITSDIKEIAKNLSGIFDISNYEIKYTYPWDRSFEIELEVI
ncbi:MAG: DUF4127 family protein, partial [Candidatus Melainabacteria bacterium]|nr:DUF4127 family protein [Candidatus Melainabacteria bacterium]